MPKWIFQKTSTDQQGDCKGLIAHSSPIYLHLIFVGYTGSKNPVRTGKKIQLLLKSIFISVWNKCPNGYFKKPVQINRGSGCWGQPMLLFFKLDYKTQISKPPEPTRHHNSIKLCILLSLRVDLLCILQYETPCSSVPVSLLILWALPVLEPVKRC